MTSRSNGAQQPQQRLLEHQYPVDTSWELTLRTTDEKVQGRIYCTDELSQTVVLQTSLVHTTLASEIRMIHASQIAKATPQDSNSSTSSPSLASSIPLPNVAKKALEEREKKSLKLAEESLRHINEKTTPKGQIVFDKLLKACSEAVWKGETIIVLNQVQVDPPYGPDQCKIMQRHASGKKALDNGSLERIKKIVAAANNSTS